MNDLGLRLLCIASDLSLAYRQRVVVAPRKVQWILQRPIGLLGSCPLRVL